MLLLELDRPRPHLGHRLAHLGAHLAHRVADPGADVAHRVADLGAHPMLLVELLHPAPDAGERAPDPLQDSQLSIRLPRLLPRLLGLLARLLPRADGEGARRAGRVADVVFDVGIGGRDGASPRQQAAQGPADEEAGEPEEQPRSRHGLFLLLCGLLVVPRAADADASLAARAAARARRFVVLLQVRRGEGRRCRSLLILGLLRGGHGGGLRHHRRRRRDDLPLGLRRPLHRHEIVLDLFRR
mmetsp:Transcript_8398/g.18156  ORF Transcript_8398/g.18156 Transcript_8398/m.18156 type:complete len:242 (-) Transcript_8398:136-861(-)